jgi:hypothetical protein
MTRTSYCNDGEIDHTHRASKKGFFMCFSKSFLACCRTYSEEKRQPVEKNISKNNIYNKHNIDKGWKNILNKAFLHVKNTHMNMIKNFKICEVNYISKTM